MDSQLKALFEARPVFAASPTLASAVKDIRAMLEMAKATLIREPWLPSVIDHDVPAADGRIIPVRTYTPEGDGPFALVLYFHGGGWSLGDLDHSDAFCRSAAQAAGCVVASVDYRLAPEHKFPAALEDCLAATLWCAAHPIQLGVDASRIALMGDSAGGNLAASVAQMLRNREGLKIAFQLLFYPATDLRLIAPSIVENAHAPVLTAEGLAWSVRNYLRDDMDAANPLASPALAENFEGLPPAMIQVASLDPLRDDGAAYAALLSGAGVSVDFRCYEGLTHSYLRFTNQVDSAAEAMRQGMAALRAAL